MLKKDINSVNRAFDVLFPNYPYHPISDYKKADLVMRHLNVSAFGEEQSFLICCDVILRIQFPKKDREFGRAVVLRAENLLPEILGTHPDHEFHMDEVEYLERKYFESGKKFDVLFA